MNLKPYENLDNISELIVKLGEALQGFNGHPTGYGATLEWNFKEDTGQPYFETNEAGEKILIIPNKKYLEIKLCIDAIDSPTVCRSAIFAIGEDRKAT